MEQRRQQFTKELGLTDKQQQQMQALREETRGKMKELQEAVRENRNALHEELQKTDLDTGEINKITSNLKGLQGEKIDYMVDNVIQMKKILTPEQYEKLSQLKDARKERRQQKKQGDYGKKRGKRF